MTTTAQPTTGTRDNMSLIFRLMRESAGLTQQNLADLAGVTRGQLGRIERGEVVTYADGQRCPFCGGVGVGPTRDVDRVTAALATYAAGSAT